ncbi:hypothetical protein [Mesonia maritima]|uniref:hypothetical protein n=1 Tax=Mesonia maritima TaxID=1793873 RepID=UPI00286B05FB|nr:hypothetical protein [Mesonia maritima]
MSSFSDMVGSFIFVTQPLSLKENNAVSCSLYPNPSNQFIYLENNSSINLVEIFDLKVVKVLPEKFNSN